jgi:hypothetical protein
MKSASKKSPGLKKKKKVPLKNLKRYYCNARISLSQCFELVVRLRRATLLGLFPPDVLAEMDPVFLEYKECLLKIETQVQKLNRIGSTLSDFYSDSFHGRDLPLDFHFSTEKNSNLIDLEVIRLFQEPKNVVGKLR